MFGKNDIQWDAGDYDFTSTAHQVVQFPQMLKHLDIVNFDEKQFKKCKWHLIAPLWWKNPALRAEMLTIDANLPVDGRIFIPHLINTGYVDELVEHVIQQQQILTKDEYQCLSPSLQQRWMEYVSNIGPLSRLLSVFYEPTRIISLLPEDFECLRQLRRSGDTTYGEYLLLVERERMQWAYFFLHPEEQPTSGDVRYEMPLTVCQEYAITPSILQIWAEKHGPLLIRESGQESIDAFVMNLHTWSGKEWQEALLCLNDNYVLDIDGLLYILQDRLASSEGYQERLEYIAGILFNEGKTLTALDILLAYHGYSVPHTVFENEIDILLESVHGIVDDDIDRYTFMVDHLNTHHYGTHVPLHF